MQARLAMIAGDDQEDPMRQFVLDTARLLLLAGGLIVASWVVASSFWPPALEAPTRVRTAKIKNDLSAIYRAAEMIKAQTGSWPANLEATVNPETPDGTPIAGGLAAMPLDPRGQRYAYELTADGPLVRFLGEDGRPGGTEEDRDYRYPPE